MGIAPANAPKKRKLPRSAWTKGNAPKSPGRPRIPDDVKQLRALSQEQIDHVGHLIMHGDEKEITRIANAKDEPLLKRMFAKCALGAMKTNNWTMLESMMSRITGGIRQQTKVVHSGRIDSVSETTAVNTNVNTTIGPDDLKQLIKELKEDV